MTLLTGTVIGPGGLPLSDAAVHFLDGPVPLPGVAQLTSDDGRFGLAAPAPGTYRLRVDAPGFGARTVTVHVRDEPEIVRDIHLAPPSE